MKLINDDTEEVVEIAFSGQFVGFKFDRWEYTSEEEKLKLSKQARERLENTLNNRCRNK